MNLDLPLRPVPSAVIFDLDGTLVDTIDLIVQTFQHVHREYLSVDLAREDALPWIGRTLADIYADVAPERAVELTDAYLEWNMAHLRDLQRTYDGARQLLDDLRADGRKIAIATSKRRRSAVASLEAAAMVDAIDVLVGMDDTMQHKPHPAPILLALERLDMAPEQAVYVGDALPDVLAAQAAGVRSVAVTWGAGMRDALVGAHPDALVHTVAGLRSVLGL